MNLAVVLLDRGLLGRASLEGLAAVGIERPFKGAGHESDELSAVPDRPESEARTRREKRRSGSPFHSQPLDEQSRTDTFEARNPILDDLASTLGIVPVRRDEANIPRRAPASRDDARKRGGE
jgi:hypothetical protein